MKKQFIIKAVCVLVLLCVLLSGCAEEEVTDAGKEHISIWYVQGDLMSEELVSLSEQFNQSSPDTWVELKAYANEAELASALDSARPELMLCGHERAFALYEQGRLRDISAQFAQALPYRNNFLSASGCVGNSFFPIGAETELLVVNGPEFEKSSVSAGGSEVFSSLESICGAASTYGRSEGRVFFTADSFTALFTAYLAKSGCGFSGVRSEDIQNETYKSIYNLLAGAAYERGLTGYDSPALPLVEKGEVVSALVSSTALTAPLGEELALYPMPSPEGSEALCFARAVGLAVTSPFAGKDAAVARFIAWLCQPDRAVSTALSLGLIPAVESSPLKDASPLTALLFELASSESLYLPALDNGYFRSDGEFERSFRAALEMLD